MGNGYPWWALGGGHASHGRPFPPEAGFLRTDGPRFVRADGSVFGWRGATMFLLLARLMRGESIDRQLQWAVSIGVNTVRVFCGGVPWGGEWEFFRNPVARADFVWSLRSLFRQCADAGMRVQAVCLTGHDTDPRLIVQTIYDVAAEFWNVSVQIGNEPHVNGIDTTAALSGVNRQGVLSCSGDYYVVGTEYVNGHPTGRDEIGDGVLPPAPFKRFPLVLDYGDLHTQRTDRYPRNGKEPLEFMGVTGVSWIDGEPWGFGEHDKGGGGSRTTDLRAAVDHHTIGTILTPGTTLHTQAGLEGRAPDPVTEPIQTAMCEAVSRMWQFIPENCYLGTYSRPHLDNFPLAWRNDDSDSKTGHAYASIHGPVAYVGVPQPRDGWTADPIDGWRIADTLNGFPNILRVER